MLHGSREAAVARRRPATSTLLAERLIHTHLSIPMSKERRQENRMQSEEFAFFRKLRSNEEYCAGRGSIDAATVEAVNGATSTASESRPPADCPPNPSGEVAELLAELATDPVPEFKVEDYWVHGEWDLDGLRDDVAMLRLERMKALAAGTQNSCEKRMALQTSWIL
eukprot:TRINITY_DN9958_c0_g1_i1.p3 TRINITY_DN9958_c0_g1~~TRINITY_DN9958_c0_g1_i1.p3  ORF type:complete len:167 (-),score=32.60 TRINITY_DN9958_c0_g1_i1:93-593(-)